MNFYMLTVVNPSLLQHKVVIRFAAWKFRRHFYRCGSEIR